MESGRDICAKFLDYRKAFDSIPTPNAPLIVKLVDSDLYDYLTNRMQQVVVDSASYHQVHAGHFCYSPGLSVGAIALLHLLALTIITTRLFLGALIKVNLLWSDHIIQVCNKAKKILSLYCTEKSILNLCLTLLSSCANKSCSSPLGICFPIVGPSHAE